ncbi:MAG: hypothetical protein AB7O62_17930 [Pirellulales bacterium]
MGVYDWIRDGVRQAVLMGFSDAIEQVGVPEQGSTMSEHLIGVLKPAPVRGIEAAKPTATVSSGSQGGRKRLGRALDSARKTAEEIA